MNNTYGRMSNFKEVLDDYKHVKFIFAHMGKYFDPHVNTFDLIKRHDNVLVDTSGISSKTIYEGLCEIGPDKIVFGSDWPYCSQKDALMSLKRAAVKYGHSNNINPDIIYEKIVWGNPSKLLCLA